MVDVQTFEAAAATTITNKDEFAGIQRDTLTHKVHVNI